MTDTLDFDSLWDYSRPAETETHFRALLPAAESQSDPYLQLLTQIGRAQGLQRRFDDAHSTLDLVEASLPVASARTRIRYLLERGRVYNSSGDPAAAKPLFEAALALAEDEPQEAYYAVDAAHMLAIVSPAEEALHRNLRALQLAESSADARARGWRGSLLNNIGWTYHEAGDFPAAFDYFQRALDFHRQHGPDAAYRIARWSVTRVRRDLGQVDVALAEQRALLAEHEALGERSGYVFEEIGECLLLLGDPEGARPYFGKAYRELSADPWLVANEPQRLERLRVLGNE